MDMACSLWDGRTFRPIHNPDGALASQSQIIHLAGRQFIVEARGRASELNMKDPIQLMMGFKL